MSNKQQTAVEWLFGQIKKDIIGLEYDYADELEEAKEMEKGQNKHAYDWGETNGADECNGDGATHENFEQYYQETYGDNK
jgi:hypothetical protein